MVGLRTLVGGKVDGVDIPQQYNLVKHMDGPTNALFLHGVALPFELDEFLHSWAIEDIKLVAVSESSDNSSVVLKHAW